MSEDSPDGSAGRETITERDLVRGVGSSALARLGAVVEIVAQPIYVALFGLAGYGLYAALWAAVNLLENVFDLGMTSALQRLVPKAESRGKQSAILRVALLVGIVPCLIVAVVLTFAAADLAPLVSVAPADRPLVVPAIILFAWAVPLWAAVEILTAALRAQRVFGAEIRLRVFWEQVLRLVFAGSFFLIVPNVFALLAAHLLSLVVVAILSLRMVALHYDLFHRDPDAGAQAQFDTVVRAGLAMLPGNIVGRGLSDVPPLVLNIAFPGAAGATATALYVIARKVASAVSMIRTAFAYVLTPLAAAASRGGATDVQAIYGYATRLSTALVLPVGVVMTMGGLAVLELFGREARAAWATLAVLIGARMIEAVVGAAVPVQQAIGGYRDQLAVSAMGFVAATALGWPLLEYGGVAGLAGAVAAGLIIVAAVPVVQMWRADHVHPFGPPFTRVAIRATEVSLLAVPVIVASYWLPYPVQLAALVLIWVGAVWASLKWSLPVADRVALGAVARKLRLV